MTRDEIELMEAGDGIDVLICSHVMNDKGKENDVWYGRFNPSRNIADAWQVVERLKEINAWIRVAYENENDPDKQWWCEVYPPNNENDGDVIEADTAPLAICRAALLAVVRRDLYKMRICRKD